MCNGVHIVKCCAGGDRADHEDAQEGDSGGVADGAGGDAGEPVHSHNAPHQRADRVAHREQVHAARRERPVHLHLPRLSLSC